MLNSAVAKRRRLCVWETFGLRLANGGEDRLHLNDMIISDAASCNQGLGAQREIHREAVYAWIGRQAGPGSAAFICLLSPSVATQARGETQR